MEHLVHDKTLGVASRFSIFSQHSLFGLFADGGTLGKECLLSKQLSPATLAAIVYGPWW